MADPDRIVHLDPRSPSWPEELDWIDGPPEELWARGRLDLLARKPRVAVVGSRSPTPYGEAQARRFAWELAARGVVVISGLARGIDRCAHLAALDAGGATMALLGSGVDQPWPAGETANRIVREGLLLSEFPPGQPPRRHHFPLRNRLISGLSDAVLVVEAAYASGSLITARWAADQGRTVCVIPGRVDHPMARGCHRLIREGATLVESPEQLAEELGWSLPPSPAHPSKESSPLLDALVGETLTAEELTRRLGRELGLVLTELVMFELAGRVVRAPGGLWRLAEKGG
ncbi:MAG: DNA-processing protein DprA [Planctomycetota bacterium]|nr:DNA-processing protein DprA [Planctomycetota bacterium]